MSNKFSQTTTEWIQTPCQPLPSAELVKYCSFLVNVDRLTDEELPKLVLNTKSPFFTMTNLLKTYGRQYYWNGHKKYFQKFNKQFSKMELAKTQQKFVINSKNVF